MASTKIYKVTGFDKVIINGVEINKVPPTLEECRWDQLQDIVKSGSLGDYFSLDSRKDIKLTTGETISMRLVSINDGTGAYSQYYPANTADFVAYNSTSNYENFSSWNGSPYNNFGGWGYSNVRTKLRQIYNYLPVELRKIIVPKTHMYMTDTAGNFESCTDRLWLPTAAEMNGGSSEYESSNLNKDYIPLKTGRSIYAGKRSTSSLEKMYLNEVGWIKHNAGFYSDGRLVNAYNDDQNLPVIIGFRIG